MQAKIGTRLKGALLRVPLMIIYFIHPFNFSLGQVHFHYNATEQCTILYKGGFSHSVAISYDLMFFDIMSPVSTAASYKSLSLYIIENLWDISRFGILKIMQLMGFQSETKLISFNKEQCFHNIKFFISFTIVPGFDSCDLLAGIESKYSRTY